MVEAKTLIDKVKDYTNLYVIQSGPLEKNTYALSDISKYAIIWGIWQADDLSNQVWNRLQITLSTFDSRIDII